MKHIQKNTEPIVFTQWKEQQRSVGVNCDYRSLQNPEKRVVHEALLQEQRHICCYCCGRIEINTSHIEHFDPQSEHEESRSVDYDNLLASCGRTAPYPKHCGNQKGHTKIEISPLQPVCEQCFTYKSNGRIEAVNVHPLRQKAEMAIDTLNCKSCRSNTKPI